MTKEEFILKTEGCQKSLRKFLTALCCGDSSLADDIAQESLMKAYINRNELRELSKFEWWVRRIAYNVFLTTRRHERRSDSPESAMGMPSKEISDSGFNYEALHLALKSLPETQRTIILLHYMEGYSTKEISLITRLSEVAVRKQLSRGREKLEKILKNFEN